MAKSLLTGKLADWMDKASGYTLAFAATCTAAGVRLALQNELGEKSRLLLFVPAVLVSAWYGGVGPGIFSLLFGALLCAWFIIPPANTINFGDHAEHFGMLLYFLVSVGIIALAYKERQEKRNYQLAQAELERLNLSLEQRVLERTAELEFANRELEGFCYNVSHDLRTPTRAIVGNIRILVEDFGDSVDGPVHQKLNRISAAALKLSDLVDALLTYARLAKADLRWDQVDLGAMVEEEARDCAAEGGRRLVLDRPSGFKVTGDGTQLRIAVRELVANSIKYGKDGEDVHLTVSTDRDGSAVTVTFHDEGIGFDDRYLHKIFQPFERLHRDEEYSGVGMGLAKVARIAQRHGGDVWAESTPGGGATFYLRLENQVPTDAPRRELVNA